MAALSSFLASRAPSSTAPAHPSLELATIPSQSVDSVQEQLHIIVSELLGSEVAPEQPLMEAGLDSLGAVELRDRVAAAFDAEVPATLTFDYPTISAMAHYLAQSSNIGTTAMSTQFRHFAVIDSTAAAAGTEISAISCRYPGPVTAGGDSGDAFWGAFTGSAELQAVVPFDRWDMEPAYSPDMGSDNMRFYARFAAFCTGVQLFDAAAFRLTAQEAAAMDPQIRMLLQEAAQAWSAADAQESLKVNSFGGGGGGVGLPVGVYVGCMYHEHLDVVTSTAAKLSPQAIVGNGAPYMVGRLSYTFGFSGTFLFYYLNNISTCV